MNRLERYLAENYYFLQDFEKGVCVKCGNEANVDPCNMTCLNCMIKDQTLNAVDEGRIDKSYVKKFLNTGNFITLESGIGDGEIAQAVEDIWQSKKTEYWKHYLEQEALKPKEPFNVPEY